MKNQYEDHEKEELNKRQLDSLENEKKKQDQRNEKIKLIYNHEGQRNSELVMEETKLLQVKLIYHLLNVIYG